MITMPATDVPPAVAADCAPAPVPSTVLAYAANRAVPLHTVTAAPAYVMAGDVIRHPAIPGLFVSVVDVTPDGWLTVKAIMETGLLAPFAVTVLLDPAAPVAVWSVPW